MRIGRNEIIEQLMEHVRNTGGEVAEWCVGTARDEAAMSRVQFQASSENLPSIQSLAYREAHTAFAAAEAADYLVDAFGLQPDRDSPVEPGKIVFIHRLAIPAHDNSPPIQKTAQSSL